jgi:gluconate 2-dehydrogenase gamma chain
MGNSFTRRDLIWGSAAFTFGALQLSAANANAPLFFTAAEFNLLDRLSELIIPKDDHSGGAHEAQVAAYIDKTVAEAFDPDVKKRWRKGLACVEDVSQKLNGKHFLQSPAAGQIAVLTSMSKNEGRAQDEAGKFFQELKASTAFAYYSSSLGIHDEMNYKGNVILEQFVGYTAV